MQSIEGVRIRVTDGVTVLSHRPVVVLTARVRPEAAGPLVARWAEARSRLASAMEACGAPLPRVPARRDGPEGVAALPAAVSDLCREIACALLAACGGTIRRSGIEHRPPPDLMAFWENWMGWMGPMAGAAAARLADRLLDPEVDQHERSRAELAAMRGSRLPDSAPPMLAAADRRGIPLRMEGEGRYQVLGQGDRQHWTGSSLTELQRAVRVRTARDKRLTGQILRDAGLPATESHRAATEDEAVAIAAGLGWPVVVKPSLGTMAQGVTLWIDTEESLRAAWRRARDLDPDVVVERHHPGEPYRISVVDGRVVGAVWYGISFVIGDGRSTVAQLIARHDAEVALPVRDSYAARQPLDLEEVGPQVRRRLAAQSLGLDSVPDAGREVVLTDIPRRLAGGRYLDVMDRIHPSTLRLAEEAARVLGLPIAGIDLIAPDITRPHPDSPVVINEVNSSPYPNVHSMADRPRPMADAILDLLFPGGDRGRIPVVAAFEGGRGALDALAALLAADGVAVGRAGAWGARLGRRALGPPEPDPLPPGPWLREPPHPGVVVLADRRVGLAALEVSARDLVSRGAPFDEADLVVLPGGWPMEEGARRALPALLQAPGGAVVLPAGAALEDLPPRRRRVAVDAGPGPRGCEPDQEAARIGGPVVAVAGSAGNRRFVLVDGAVGEVLLAPPGGLPDGPALHDLAWAAAILVALGRAPGEIRRLLASAPAVASPLS